MAQRFHQPRHNMLSCYWCKRKARTIHRKSEMNNYSLSILAIVTAIAVLKTKSATALRNAKRNKTVDNSHSNFRFSPFFNGIFLEPKRKQPENFGMQNSQSETHIFGMWQISQISRFMAKRKSIKWICPENYSEEELAKRFHRQCTSILSAAIIELRSSTKTFALIVSFWVRWGYDANKTKNL